MRQVQLRLDSRDFGFPRTGPRGPSAVIADEIRPVIAGVETIPLLEAREVDAAAFPIEIPLTIPERVSETSGSFLVASALPLDTQEKVNAERLRELTATAWIQLDKGWRIIRDESGGDVLRLDEVEELDGRALVRLSALLPPPRALESRSFRTPADAALHLGYGLTGTGPDPRASTEFRASLRCGDGPFDLVHQASIEHGPSAHWQDVRIALPDAPSRCRLRLEAETSGDTSTAAPVWSVPRITAAKNTETPPRNLVLISIDTLRADRLSGYGNPRETSPAIDRELIARGTRFSDLSTVFPRTNIAHLGLFTGLYPVSFGAVWYRLPFTSPIRTLTEQLADIGFETVAFTESGLMSRRQGFWYGFDRFAEQPARVASTFSEGTRYLDGVGSRQFFLFLHTYRPHAPYRPAQEFAELYDPKDRRGPNGSVPAVQRPASTRYDREIRETDALLAGFLGRLDSLGLSERTYVALVSDHGEAFGEHHHVFHGRSAFQEELHVPFVIRGPQVPSGKTIDTPASIVDLAPTLLDLLGGAPLAMSQGRSLAPALRGEVLEEAPIYFEWMGHKRPRGVRVGRFKALNKRRGKSALILYDLEEDPEEQHPIRGPHPARDEARRLLEAYEAAGLQRSEALAPGPAEPVATPVDRNVLLELKALGYLE